MKPSDLFLSALQFALTTVLAALAIDADRSVEDMKMEREAAAAMLAELRPLNAIQASYAARVVIMFHTSMECFRRAAEPGISLALKARLLGRANALSRQSAQMEKLLLQAKRAGEPVSSASGMEAMLLRAGEVVMQRQAAQAEAERTQAASEAAASDERKNPIHQEKAATAAPRPASANQKPMHQSAAAPLPQETDEDAINACALGLAAYRATLADLGQAAAD
jgi:hypothetical protein